MDTQLDILQTMKEKATQAANDSLGNSERKAIQDELNKLTEELNDIGNNTSFNGTDLLTGSGSDTSPGVELNFQTGASKNDTFETTIDNTTADKLGNDSSPNIASGADNSSISGFKQDVTGSAGARKDAIEAIDDGIDDITGQLSDLGATQNRLSFKQENLETSTNNLSAAQSRIEDADFAKEQTEVAKLQVQQQSGTAQLAQANASGQSVLSLLGG
jgi:flagellin